MKLFHKIEKANGRIYIYCGKIKLFSIKLKSSNLKKFYNTCVGIIQIPYINYRLRTVKYVHLMHTEKFTESSIQFFNENFNAKDHLFLCVVTGNYSNIPKAFNSIRLRYIKGLTLGRKNIQKIICHGLFIPEVMDWLYTHSDISRKKCYWVIWGGDLYGAYGNAMNSPKDLAIRQNFKGYISAFDKQKACEMLDLNMSKFYRAFVPCPITKEMINKTTKAKHDYIQIQINHSCNKNTLEMLDILSKWKDKNIHISTVLSYGDMTCAEEIKEKGKTIFGDRFSYLDHMVSGQEYTQFLAQNDILILNHNRQQGMGNAFAALNLGVKMFIKSDVSTYHFFNDEEGIKVFDTYKIKDMPFEKFTSYAEKEDNLKKATRYYDNDYLAGLWHNIFLSK